MLYCCVYDKIFYIIWYQLNHFSSCVSICSINAEPFFAFLPKLLQDPSKFTVAIAAAAESGASQGDGEVVETKQDKKDDEAEESEDDAIFGLFDE